MLKYCAPSKLVTSTMMVLHLVLTYCMLDGSIHMFLEYTLPNLLFSITNDKEILSGLIQFSIRYASKAQLIPVYMCTQPCEMIKRQFATHQSIKFALITPYAINNSKNNDINSYHSSLYLGRPTSPGQAKCTIYLCSNERI